jgi:hypothetical protein
MSTLPKNLQHGYVALAVEAAAAKSEIEIEGVQVQVKSADKPNANPVAATSAPLTDC